VSLKYSAFAVDTINKLLSKTGWQIPAPSLQHLAPVGISFFVLQSTAYLIDVYRNDVEPAGAYLDHLAFMSFFPTLVSGPILRARQFFPRLCGKLNLSSEAGSRALFLIAIGLVKKIAIADYLSANFVDRVFDFPDRFSSLEVLTAIYAYALQIYA